MLEFVSADTVGSVSGVRQRVIGGMNERCE